MTKQEKADCLKILDHYGWVTEYLKLIEKMGELKEAMEKFATIESRETPKGLTYEQIEKSNEEFDEVLKNVQEGTADVEICLQHLKCFMGGKAFRTKVAEYRKAKIARQLQRMEAGK